MYKSLLLLVGLVSVLTLQAQTDTIPKEVHAFIPPGYAILAYQAGDINGDQLQDGLLIVKNPAEDSSGENMQRPLLVLVRQANGQLKQVVRNDSAIMCRNCGGVFGDPFESLDPDGNRFTINFYGGSNWRWAVSYSFLYNKARADWLLDNETQISYLSSDPEKSTEYNIWPGELGEVSIGQFNVDPGYATTEWKVMAAKTFFYNNPDLTGKPRKGYLLKGDKVTSYRELKHFVRVSYTNKKEETTYGFLLKKDLKRIK